MSDEFEAEQLTQLERLVLFRELPDFISLRREGMRLLPDGKLIAREEWSREVGVKLFHHPDFSAFMQRCEEVGARYGLAHWTVQRVCLERAFTLDDWPFALPLHNPRLAYVLPNDVSPLFQEWALFAVGRAPVPASIIGEDGGLPVEWVRSPYYLEPDQALDETTRPKLDAAFRVRVEVPAELHPSAAAAVRTDFQHGARLFASALGYEIGERVRNWAGPAPEARMFLAPGLDPAFAGRLRSEAARLFGPVDSFDPGDSIERVIPIPCSSYRRALVPTRAPALSEDAQRIPISNAFVVQVDVSPRMPIATATAVQHDVQVRVHDLLRSLGTALPQRRKASKLVTRASELHMAREHLDRRETGDILEDAQANPHDLRARHRTATRRNQVKQRARRISVVVPAGGE